MSAMVVRDVTSVAKVDTTRAFEPRDITEAYDLAKLLVASGLMPRGISRPESAFAIIATGRELGLSAMQSLRSIHIIEGKPTLSADLVCALVKNRSDVCQYFRLVESTPTIARYETHRRGEPAPTAMSFSIEDARAAGVTGKDNWKKYPAAMLRARCITALARAVYPDLAMGLYDPDEIAEPEPRRAPVAMQPSVVVDDAQPPAPSREAFGEFVGRLAGAADKASINRAVAALTKAHKAGEVSNSDFEDARVMVARRRAQLESPTVAPPEFVDPSGYDANEAEAEAMASAVDE